VLARAGGVHVFGAVMPFREAASLGYDRISGVEIATARTIWTEPIPGDAIATPRGWPAPILQVIPGGRNPR
jgi:hypothetical protein